MLFQLTNTGTLFESFQQCFAARNPPQLGTITLFIPKAES